MLGHWPGHSDDGLRCAYTLRKAAGDNVGEDEEAWVNLRKCGCTCGACIHGWFSPRTRFRLIHHSIIWNDIMNDGHSGFNADGNFIDPGGVPGYEHLSTDLQRNIHPKFFDGYRRTVVAVGDACAKNQLPTPDNISAHARTLRTSRPYFSNGGKVEYALSCVLDVAEEGSVLSSGDFEGLMEDTAGDDAMGKSWNALPVCANDLEFGMVKLKLGLSYRSTWPSPDNDGDDEDMGEIEDF